MKPSSCNLSGCFLCHNCIPEWKELVKVHKETFTVKKGEAIFSEGDKVTGIYFINNGAIKIHKQWIDRKELIIRFAAAGDIIGHRGVAAGDHYPVSATALTVSTICLIPASFLETLLKADHGLTHSLMQFYLTELQKAELRMRNLALMEVKGRIAEALLELEDLFGKDDNGYITVPVTRQDIASYAGTTYETVFKYLSTLEASRTIKSVGKSIRINNPAKLKKVVATAR